MRFRARTGSELEELVASLNQLQSKGLASELVALPRAAVALL